MRVLWITHPESDYLASTLYRGMYLTLGKDIVDYPWKGSYHGVTDYYEQPNGRGPGCTAPNAWQKPSESTPRTISDIVNDRFDCIICESTRPYALAALEQVCESGNVPPVFLCCGEDYSDLSLLIESGKRFGATALFKRELEKDIFDPNIYPCPFSSVIPDDWPEYVGLEKEWDACLIVGNTNVERQDYVDRLAELDNISTYAGSNRDGVRLDQFEFWSVMSKSKVGLSVRGWGWDTLRFWEVPSLKTMLLTQRLNIRYPNPFTDNVNCLEFSSPDEMVHKLRTALSDNRWKEIAELGYQHMLNYHTCTKRAEYVLGVIETCIT